MYKDSIVIAMTICITISLITDITSNISTYCNVSNYARFLYLTALFFQGSNFHEFYEFLEKCKIYSIDNLIMQLTIVWLNTVAFLVYS